MHGEQIDVVAELARGAMQLYGAIVSATHHFGGCMRAGGKQLTADSTRSAAVVIIIIE